MKRNAQRHHLRALPWLLLAALTFTASGCAALIGGAAGGAAGYVAGHHAGEEEAEEEIHDHHHDEE